MAKGRVSFLSFGDLKVKEERESLKVQLFLFWTVGERIDAASVVSFKKMTADLFEMRRGRGEEKSASASQGKIRSVCVERAARFFCSATICPAPGSLAEDGAVALRSVIKFLGLSRFGRRAIVG